MHTTSTHKLDIYYSPKYGISYVELLELIIKESAKYEDDRFDSASVNAWAYNKKGLDYGAGYFTRNYLQFFCYIGSLKSEPNYGRWGWDCGRLEYSVADDAMQKLKNRQCYRCKETFPREKINGHYWEDGFCDQCFIEVEAENIIWLEKRQTGDGFKVCSKCNEKKQLSKFHRKPNGKFGRQEECKSCRNPLGRTHVHKKQETKDFNQVARKYLHDSYIKQRLYAEFKIKTKDITPEMINIKREQLLMERLMKKGA